MKFFVILFFFLFSLSTGFTQQTIIKLNEGFENNTFPPQDWKRYNVLGANVWQRLTAPLPPEIMQPPIQGTGVARINYESTGGEDWLVTKKINSVASEDSLSFFIIKQYSQGPYPPDSLDIKVSVTDSAMNSFTYLLLNINVAGIPTGNQTWHKYTLSLSQFSGQNIFIAFQHKDYSGHGLALDSVVVFNKSSIGIKSTEGKIPEQTLLYQNYPNPFNPKTTIGFSLRKTEYISLIISDLLGKTVSEIFKGRLKAGNYSAEFDGSDVPSGIYFYRLQTENGNYIRKMILIK